MSETRIRNSGLPALTINALTEEGFETLGDIAHLSDKELLRIPFMGKKGVAAIREIVEAPARAAKVAAFAPPSGMSLRDWFAGQAMASAVRNLGVHYHSSDDERLDCKGHTAKMAYEMADAMLAARSEGGADNG